MCPSTTGWLPTTPCQVLHCICTPARGEVIYKQAEAFRVWVYTLKPKPWHIPMPNVSECHALLGRCSMLYGTTASHCSPCVVRHSSSIEYTDGSHQYCFLGSLGHFVNFGDSMSIRLAFHSACSSACNRAVFDPCLTMVREWRGQWNLQVHDTCRACRVVTTLKTDASMSPVA